MKQLAIAAGILLVSIGSLERVVAALGLIRPDLGLTRLTSSDAG